MTTTEVEVFRLMPQVGKYYETGRVTRVLVNGGKYLEQRYFTSEPLRYVGRFKSQHSWGAGDGKQVWDLFDNNGHEERVDYTYEGTTCYREVLPTSY